MTTTSPAPRRPWGAVPLRRDLGYASSPRPRAGLCHRCWLGFSALRRPAPGLARPPRDGVGGGAPLSWRPFLLLRARAQHDHGAAGQLILLPTRVLDGLALGVGGIEPAFPQLAVSGRWQREGNGLMMGVQQ